MAAPLRSHTAIRSRGPISKLRSPSSAASTRAAPSRSALLYSTSIRWAIDAVLALCPTITIRGIADDCFFCGPLPDVLRALDLYKIELAKQSQVLQTTKTVIYLPSTPTTNGTASIAAQCAARSYTAGPGFLAAGSPIGDRAFCIDAVSSLFQGIASKLAAVCSLAVVFPKPQELYRLMRYCITPSSVGYLLRTTPPDLIALQASIFDDATFHTILGILGVPNDDPVWNPQSPTGIVSAAVAHVDACAGGLGITSALSASAAAYSASLFLTMHLITPILPDGITPEAMALLFPTVAAVLSSPTRPDKLEHVTFDTLRTTPVSKVQRALAPAIRRSATERVLALILNPAERATFLSGLGNGALWLMGRPRFEAPLAPNQWSILVKSRLLLSTVTGCICQGQLR